MTLASAHPLGAPVELSAADHRPAAAHAGDRIWRETNCYLDLWIEVLHVLGHDPAPAFGCALSADHDGEQWTFVKPEPNDLRDIYGLVVAEETVWRPVLDTVESGPRRGLLHTVEVDSWWLPDTEGTDYRSGHVKTTIVPLRVDRSAERMTYIHNAGVFELSGADFAGVFGLSPRSEWVLLPYVEQIRRVGGKADIRPETVVAAARAHLDRRAPGNPVDRLADGVRDALGWLPAAGVQTFHQWAFATLRQCGATAEIAADLAGYLSANGVDRAGGAAEPLRSVAGSAKTVQFKLARAARGRTVDVDAALARMAGDWARALDLLDDVVPSG